MIIWVSNTNIVFSAPDGSFCDYNPAQIAVFSLKRAVPDRMFL